MQLKADDRSHINHATQHNSRILLNSAQCNQCNSMHLTQHTQLNCFDATQQCNWLLVSQIPTSLDVFVPLAPEFQCIAALWVSCFYHRIHRTVVGNNQQEIFALAIWLFGVWFKNSWSGLIDFTKHDQDSNRQLQGYDLLSATSNVCSLMLTVNSLIWFSSELRICNCLYL